MGKEKIVLDTNILISALGWEGPPKAVFRKILNKEFELIISQKQMGELERVLNYPKFKFTEEQKDTFLEVIAECGIVVETHNGLDIIKEDPDDNIILESAIENNAKFIISGDEHLLKLKNFKYTKIVTPREFLALI